ncbi:Homeobox domain containing protein [Lasiodiplodia theobromae]|uniref:Homeobox domain containing protein n=1 Tax=Lasiodiplodia theobromae TaxID=45133 RepID=UPI0015C39784|nr:Homeobox domain containing protein [Lasiodiplodia theobromae]KAF4539855.1 Homeobox domain containing protein [Lasiodiplodia theobromae]
MAPGPRNTGFEFSESPLTSPTEPQSAVQIDDKGDKAEDEAASHRSQMQRWWDKSISKNLSVHNGYKQTFVLFIKWNDEIDQLKVGKEVSELRDVFEKRFHFTTKTVELGLNKATTKLEHAILGMLMKYDDPQNLLIIYYAGHGFYHKDKKKLQLAGTTDDSIRGVPLPEVFWQDAEKHLTKSNCSSDVLSIMDCCFASDINRSYGENSRVCELLAASHIGRTTEQPGDNSFTRALIDSLNYLLTNDSGDGAFDTHQLHQEINRRRTDNPSGLWRRLPGNSRHILISPQRLGPLGMDQGTKPSEHQEQPKGLLSLQFVLGVNELNENTIEELTRHLPNCFNSCRAPVRNIKWLGFSGKTRRTKSLDSFASIVRELIKTNKQKRQQEQLQVVDQDEAYQSSDVMKRKADEVELLGSEIPKRLRRNDSESHSSVE